MSMFDWFRVDAAKVQQPIPTYFCKIHGNIKAEHHKILYFADSKPLCAQCLISWLNEHFGIEEK